MRPTPQQELQQGQRGNKLDSNFHHSGPCSHWGLHVYNTLNAVQACGRLRRPPPNEGTTCHYNCLRSVSGFHRICHLGSCAMTSTTLLACQSSTGLSHWGTVEGIGS
mmetsp:Transcript_55207/g.161104  ORF Transcript_55207/g.161104 Transcript_55207/m.161104 type:complete len:107 (+) Transcript_55207:152-472(+)